MTLALWRVNRVDHAGQPMAPLDHTSKREAQAAVVPCRALDHVCHIQTRADVPERNARIAERRRRASADDPKAIGLNTAEAGQQFVEQTVDLRALDTLDRQDGEPDGRIAGAADPVSRDGYSDEDRHGYGGQWPAAAPARAAPKQSGRYSGRSMTARPWLRGPIHRDSSNPRSRRSPPDAA